MGDAFAEEYKSFAEEYKSSLEDLNCNSKPYINFMTILAEENINCATQIVNIIVEHIQTVPPERKLPVLYLIDSIIKNVGQQYRVLFCQSIISLFASIFEKVDEGTRALMYKLRQTWNDIFPNKILYNLDIRIQQVDPAWPITAQPPAKSIHINPKFLGATTVEKPPSLPVLPAEEEIRLKAAQAEVLKQLFAKQRQLRLLEQKKQELVSKQWLTAQVPPTEVATNSQRQVDASVLGKLNPQVTRRDPRLQKVVIATILNKNQCETNKAVKDAEQCDRSDREVSEKPVLSVSSFTTEPNRTFSVQQEITTSVTTSQTLHVPPAFSLAGTTQANVQPVTSVVTSPLVPPPPLLAVSLAGIVQAPPLLAVSLAGIVQAPPTSTAVSATTVQVPSVVPIVPLVTATQFSSQALEDIPVPEAGSSASVTQVAPIVLPQSSDASAETEKTISKSDERIPELPKDSKATDNALDGQFLGNDEDKPDAPKHDQRTSPSRSRTGKRKRSQENKVSEPDKPEEMHNSPPKRPYKEKGSKKKVSPKDKSPSKSSHRHGSKRHGRHRSRSPLHGSEKISSFNTDHDSFVKKSKQKDNIDDDTKSRLEGDSRDKNKKLENEDIDLRIFGASSSEQEKRKRDYDEDDDDESKENISDSRGKKSVKDKDSDTDSLFGVEDQDYRQLSNDRNNSEQKSWALYKAAHPDQFKMPLRSTSRESLDKSIDNKDDSSPYDKPGSKSFGSFPEFDQIEYDRLGRPRLYKMRHSIGLESDEMPSQREFNNRYGPQSPFADKRFHDILTKDPKYVLRQAEEQYQLGRISEAEFNDIRLGLEKVFASDEFRRFKAFRQHLRPLPPENFHDKSYPSYVKREIFRNRNEPRFHDNGEPLHIKEEPLDQGPYFHPPLPVGTFRLDNKSRTIHFVDEKAIVLMDNDEPRELIFRGNPTPVFIEGRKPIMLRFDGKPVEVELHGRICSLKFGAPSRELYVNRWPYEAKFGGPPIEVFVNGRVYRMSLGGPPPQVQVSDRPAHDLYRAFLARTGGTICHSNVPSTGNFYNGSRGSSGSNDMPFDIDLRSRGRPKLNSDVNDRDWRHSGSVLEDVNQNYPAHCHSQVGGDLSRSQTIESKPWDQLSDAGFRPPISDGQMSREWMQFHPIKLENDRDGLRHTPSPDVMANRSDWEYKPPQSVGPQTDQPSSRPWLSQNFRPEFTERPTVGPQLRQPLLPPWIRNPVSTSNRTLLPPPPRPPPHMGMPVPSSTPLLPPPLPPLSAITPGVMPFTPTSQLGDPGAPINVDASNVPEPVPKIDIGQLFDKLLAAGIISKPNVSVNPDDVDTKKEVKEEEEKIYEEEPEIVEEKIPPIELSLESLRNRYPGVITALYRESQCASCGMRFKDIHGERYSRHLDWHFRMNRREKDGVKKAFSRKWYYEVEDWIQFEEFEDFEERARSFFELQADEQFQLEATLEVPSVPASGQETEVCVVCDEPFQLFWVEEEEEWHLRNAVRHDGQAYHPSCYEDFKKISEAPEPPVQEGELLKEEDIKKEVTTIPEEDMTDTSVEILETLKKEDSDAISEIVEMLTATVVANDIQVEVKEEPMTPEPEALEESKEEELEGKPGEEEIIGVITESDVENEPQTQAEESEKVVLQSGGIVMKVRAESLKPASPATESSGEKEGANKDRAEEGEEEEEFRPPTPDPRFQVLPPVQRGTELSGLCCIM